MMSDASKAVSPAHDHARGTQWKAIRLELGRTSDFPTGSVSRAYVVRLPVTDHGNIDEPVLIGNPRRATGRRFWPCEPDRLGHVVHTDSGWAFRCNCSEQPDAILKAKRVELGEEILIAEGNGPQLPFRVASIKSVGRSR